MQRTGVGLVFITLLASIGCTRKTTPRADPDADAPAPLPAPGRQTEPPDDGLLTKRQPIDDKYPLPQNPEKARQLREARVAEYRKAMVDAFLAGGHTKAPWADAATKAMEAYARRCARSQIGYVGVEYQDFLEALKVALDAGCDDPLIRYWQYRFYDLNHSDFGWEPERYSPEKRAQLCRDVLRRLPETRYPAWLRVHMLLNTWNYMVFDQKKKPGLLIEAELESVEKEFWRVFAEVAGAQDRSSQESAYDIGVTLCDNSDREAKWKSVDKVFEAAQTARWVRLAVEGHYLVSSAWDARGDGPGSTVTPEGGKLFAQRLVVARDRLESAWREEPSFAKSAVSMIEVTKGLNLGRDEMERWFRRAMEADPDCFAACRCKLEWLMPKWYGTQEQVDEFAYQCYRTKNWHAHIALLLDVDRIMYPIVNQYVIPPSSDPVTWRNNKAVYEGYLKEYPEDRYARSRYAVVCVRSGRPDVAAEQFKALKDRPWTWMFQSRQQYERYREIAMTGRLPKHLQR
jgi:hypothetical protein